MQQKKKRVVRSARPRQKNSAIQRGRRRAESRSTGITLRFKFVVAKIAETSQVLFAPDPNDPRNTFDTGRWVQEVTLIRLPDGFAPGALVGGGGLGSITLTLNDLEKVGKFSPGQKVTVELSV